MTLHDILWPMRGTLPFGCGIELDIEQAWYVDPIERTACWIYTVWHCLFGPYRVREFFGRDDCHERLKPKWIDHFKRIGPHVRISDIRGHTKAVKPKFPDNIAAWERRLDAVQA